MNGLEALEEIKDDMEYVTRLDFVEPIVRGGVQKNLFKIYHRELPQLDLIEEELKALEIIKRLFNVSASYNSVCKEYTISILPKPNKLAKAMMNVATKDEYDLLKEVMK